tara:strand:- start:142 stop:312 length:171 start_codon:yes stop_codon:yes gene_type:complete
MRIERESNARLPVRIAKAAHADPSAREKELFSQLKKPQTIRRFHDNQKFFACGKLY